MDDNKTEKQRKEELAAALERMKLANEKLETADKGRSQTITSAVDALATEAFQRGKSPVEKGPGPSSPFGSSPVSQSDSTVGFKTIEQQEGKEQDGGFFDFLGIGGGRRRRRKKSRKKKRKSKKKRRKSRKKRRRRKRGGVRWGASGNKQVGDVCSWSVRGSECAEDLRCVNKKCVKVEDGSAENVGVGDIPAVMAMKTHGLVTGKKTAGGGKTRRKKRKKNRKSRRRRRSRRKRR